MPRHARLADDADWVCEPADFSALGKPAPAFSWINPKILWESRNNVLASVTGDPTDDARRAWVKQQRERLTAAGEIELARDFVVDRPELEDFSFMVMGDTGEGDTSQFAVVPSLLAASKGTEFALIASDVVYPAGDINQYVPKFFVPYAPYPRPIYAVPGNHDWLDGLSGFMRHFCGASQPEEKFFPPAHERHAAVAKLLHSAFWRRAGKLAPKTLDEARALRGAAEARGPRQPNMYFCIDTPKLRLVMIDVGILGRLDPEQGAWLRRVSAGPKPKLLVTGKPIYANAAVSPRRILPDDGTGAGPVSRRRRKAGPLPSAGTILEVVRDPANNYVAAVAGDVHNYQHYGVRSPSGRRQHFFITGGGGAFMTATHFIPKVTLPGVEKFVCFPTRGDSLRAYSIVLQRKTAKLRFWERRKPPRGIPADEAAAIVAKRHGLPMPKRADGTPVTVSARSKRLADAIFPAVGSRWAHRISEALDWDDPPFFKNFMRFDVSGGVLRIRTYGVSGCKRYQDDPPVIDEIEIPLGVGGGDAPDGNGGGGGVERHGGVERGGAGS